MPRIILRKVVLTSTILLLAAGPVLAMRDPGGRRGPYADGMDLYEYVTSSPVKAVDGLGLNSLTITKVPGWFDDKRIGSKSGAKGQMRSAYNVKVGDCICDEDKRKWWISSVDATVELSISLNADKITGEVDATKAKEATIDTVYGHEQRHVRAVEAALNEHRQTIVNAMDRMTNTFYTSKNSCDRTRKRTKGVIDEIKKTLKLGFGHSNAKPGSEANPYGKPAEGKPYPPDPAPDKEPQEGRIPHEGDDAWTVDPVYR
ncbi:MAG TPA: hypothetical protein PLP01_03385 [Phycisphaerae bacterium]|nr:hypothetical protein [Phycisphaerae bacterium]HOI54269.1 hypothetical protein [Phycisphaerae bacterium]